MRSSGHGHGGPELRRFQSTCAVFTKHVNINIKINSIKIGTILAIRLGEAKLMAAGGSHVWQQHASVASTKASKFGLQVSFQALWSSLDLT